MIHSPAPTIDLARLPDRRPLAGPLPAGVKWSWSCRELSAAPSGDAAFRLEPLRDRAPEAGDVVAVRIARIGNHTRLMTSDHERLRLYPGDAVVGVLGNRYATDAFEGRVLGTDELHMLTGAGMIGTVESRHDGVGAPTRVEFLGYLTGDDGRPINLIRRLFRPRTPDAALPEVLMVVGTGMNSGKTTTVRKLVHALVRQGRRVAACKLTGSVSQRDLHELRATGAVDARDFSDYGFPSTYLLAGDALVRLFQTMLADAVRARPDAIVVEVADGVLQRETRMLLEDATVKELVAGVLLSASCAPSALHGADVVAATGHRLLAVSGMITASPLFVREFRAHSTLPVLSSAGDGRELAERLGRTLATGRSG